MKHANELTLREIEQKLSDYEDLKDKLEAIKAICTDGIVTSKPITKDLTGIVLKRKPKESFATYNRRKAIAAGIPPKRKHRPKKAKRKSNGKGTKQQCENPLCREVSGRASRNFISHGTKFCCRECGVFLSNRLRGYAVMVVDGHNTQAKAYTRKYPFILNTNQAKRVRGLIDSVQKLKNKQLSKDKATKKGTKIFSNTPSAH
ncbi:MAG: hypothetical protein GY906_24560 [bacterium]|nr:hypothetical protein [bacterium]